MSDAGCTHVVMEVSSHALTLDRVYGIRFAVGIFTNLSQDHLDFHHTMEAYCDAKAILFDRCDIAIYNADDPWHERMLAHCPCRTFSYSAKGDADLCAKSIQLHAGSVDYDAQADTDWAHVHVGIPAMFTVYNTLDAIAACWNLGVPIGECADALAKNHGVKGRMEIIAARLADFSIVTSDNPRTEEPLVIIDDILQGMQGCSAYVVEPDRVKAIHYAMDHAKPGDVIVLAGKGHEDYQEINHRHIHMDEREIVAQHLREMR